MRQLSKITDELPVTQEGLRIYLRHLEPELKEASKRMDRLTKLKEETENRLDKQFGIKAGAK